MLKNRNIPIAALAIGLASGLMLAACDQSGSAAPVSAPVETANPSDAGIKPGYAIEVQKLKAGPEEAFESRLAELNSRFGIQTPPEETSPAPSGAQSGGQPEALGKTSATLVESKIVQVSQVPRVLFYAQPGDRLDATVRPDPANPGPFDPMAVLIQFDDPDFKTKGIIKKTGQNIFRLLHFSDDASTGDLAPRTQYTFREGQSGYFLWMILPYSSANSTARVWPVFNLFSQACPLCDWDWQTNVKTGGAIFRGKAGNEFFAGRTTAVGDPRLYVFQYSALAGKSNGDQSSLTVKSRVLYELTQAQSTIPGNFILVDNDGSSTGSFDYTQYAP